jgi:hypothetical protein
MPPHMLTQHQFIVMWSQVSTVSQVRNRNIGRHRIRVYLQVLAVCCPSQHHPISPTEALCPLGSYTAIMTTKEGQFRISRDVETKKLKGSRKVKKHLCRHQHPHLPIAIRLPCTARKNRRARCRMGMCVLSGVPQVLGMG